MPNRSAHIFIAYMKSKMYKSSQDTNPHFNTTRTPPFADKSYNPDVHHFDNTQYNT